MEKELRKIIKGLNQIKLSSAEKERMRENLRLFITQNPARGEAPAKFNIFPQFILRPVPIVALLGMLMLAGAGTSLAAETALPGEALYSVKVGVNEKVRAAFAVSDEAEAKLAAELAKRRVAEAAELNAKGKFTGEAEVEIESRLTKHVAKFEEKTAKLSAEGKAALVLEISSDLEAALNAHGQVIASSPGKSSPLLNVIQTKLGTVVKTRASAEARISTGAKADVEAAAEGKLKAAENKIAEVRGLIEKTRGSVSASTTLEAEARLELAEKVIIAGKARMEADAFAEAFASFDQAHRLAQEAQVLINASERLRIKTENKYGGCPLPAIGMPNWICPDGSTAGPVCEDGRWVIKQCPSSPSPASESKSEVRTEVEQGTQSWLNKIGF